MNQHTTIQQLEGLLAYHDAGCESWLVDGDIKMGAGSYLTICVEIIRHLAAGCRRHNISLLGLAKAAVDAAEQDRLRSAPTQTPSPPAAP
jgi:hypothetical protein